MSDDIIKRLRDAIAAGPTPGPWKIRAERYRFIHVYATGGGICHLDTVDGEGAANAKLIAAASPDNITALLDRLAEADEMRNVLIGNGFVKCDISACNCGSWHARFGLPERMREIQDALSDAGHPLSNGNGNLAINALRQLVAERDATAKAFLELHATVVGECPALLNEDSGGSSLLIELVADALARIEQERPE